MYPLILTVNYFFIYLFFIIGIIYLNSFMSYVVQIYEIKQEIVMTNLFDYILWRGDLSFDSAPFCDLDDLIFSYLSYVNFAGIVPGFNSNTITLKEASDLFFSINDENSIRKSRSFLKNAPLLLKEMAKTRRYSNCQLMNYVNNIDTKIELQFSAITIITDNFIPFISFSGTDDSIIGWKEDFNLSYKVVPAEKESVKYLNKACMDFEHNIRIGGHSKGGHLAIYSAAKCKKIHKDKIVSITDFDGPGFSNSFIESNSLKSIFHLIKRFIPESSIVGTLLENPVSPIIIKSSANGILQHDPLTWILNGPQFVISNDLDNLGKFFDDTLSLWLDQIDTEKRKTFTDELFSVLEASGATTLTQLSNCKLKQYKAMISQLDKISPESRSIIELLMKTAFSKLIDSAKPKNNWLLA